MIRSRPNPKQLLLGLVLVCLAAWCVKAFFDASRMYADFWQPTASLQGLPTLELVFQLWYLAYGLTFVAALAWGLRLLGVGGPIGHTLRRLARWKYLPALLCFLVGAGSFLFRWLVLRRQVITDDEEVYLFIAKTLLEGRIVNPLPDEPDFYANQFVVLNERGWFGKYPIGHPMVLAVALALRVPDVVLPVMGGVTTFLTWRLGRKLLGPRRAIAAAALLAVSPHFVWTHATLLSQPTSCLLLMIALLGLHEWERTRGVKYAWLAGGALGFCFFARPLPGGLFALLAVAVVGRAFLRERKAPILAALIAVSAPVGVAVGLTGVVHQLQSGSPLKSGYHGAHRSLGVGGYKPGEVGQSVLGGVVRENFWLFGWPLSLLPLLAARPRRGQWLLWGPIAAEIVYRIGVPKTVVSTTGPTYLLEAVPVLALLSADGLARVQLWARTAQLRPAWRQGAILFTLASSAAALLFFVPVQLASIGRGVDERLAVYDLLREAGASRALVFARAITVPSKSQTWAYYPPSPSPMVDDDILFLRMPKGDDAGQRALSYWRQRFGDRPAFVFMPGDPPQLVPLEAFANAAPTEPRAPEERR